MVNIIEWFLKENEDNKLSRRDFLKGTAGVAVAATVLPKVEASPVKVEAEPVFDILTLDTPHIPFVAPFEPVSVRLYMAPEGTEDWHELGGLQNFNLNTDTETFHFLDPEVRATGHHLDFDMYWDIDQIYFNTQKARFLFVTEDRWYSFDGVMANRGYSFSQHDITAYFTVGVIGELKHEILQL